MCALMSLELGRLSKEVHLHRRRRLAMSALSLFASCARVLFHTWTYGTISLGFHARRRRAWRYAFPSACVFLIPCDPLILLSPRALITHLFPHHPCTYLIPMQRTTSIHAHKHARGAAFPRLALHARLRNYSRLSWTAGAINDHSTSVRVCVCCRLRAATTTHYHPNSNPSSTHRHHHHHRRRPASEQPSRRRSLGRALNAPRCSALIGCQ